MGQNRVIGGSFNPAVVNPTQLAFTTYHGSDAYLVSPLSAGTNPVACTLDENPADGDRVIIKDLSGFASENNITIASAKGIQPILGHSSIVLNQAYASVQLLYAADRLVPGHGVWIVVFLLNSSSAPQ